MPTANIKINGTAASNDDLPINTLVQLDNLGIGGETTYAWSIASQPEGTADVLSSAVIQNPTFTPKKEGTYYIQLTVNGTFVDRKVVGIRDLKTRQRAPAALEKTEVDGTGFGWAVATNRWLALLSSLRGNEQGVVTCYAGGTIARGDLATCNGVQTIKSGLPGTEDLLKVIKLGSSNEGSPVGIMEGNVNGTTSAVLGDLIRVRFWGLYSQTIAGAPLSGDPVYHTNEVPDLVLGAGRSRAIGVVINAGGGFYRIFVTGLFPHVGAAGSNFMQPRRTYSTWGLSGIAANTLAQVMNFPVAGSGLQAKGAVGTFCVRKLEADLDINATGATVTFEIYVNGVATGKTVAITAGSKTNGSEFNRSLVFDTGQTVEVRASTPAGWTSTAAKASVAIVVEDLDDGT